VVVTSQQPANALTWFVAGNNVYELGYITLNDQTLTTVSTPFEVTGLAVLPVFDVPYKQYIYVVGSGGAVDVSVNPVLPPGFYLNQQVAVVGTSDTNTVTIDNGLGTSQNGFITLGLDNVIDYYWNGSYWSEENRR
jgi:hypothetical protein